MRNNKTNELKLLRRDASRSQTFLPFDVVKASEDADVIYEETYVTKEELQAWNDFLGRTSDCMSETIVRACSLDVGNHIACGAKLRHPIHIRTNRCNQRGYCPNCAYRSATKRAYEIYDVIEDEVAKRVPFPLVVNQLVFTLPEELQGMSYKEYRKVIHEVMKDKGDYLTFKRYAELLRKFDRLRARGKVTDEGYRDAKRDLDRRLDAGRLVRAYATAIQTYEKDVFTDHLHAHVMLLNAAFSPSTNGKDGLDDGSFVKKDHYYEEEELRWLKRRYNKALGRPEDAPVDVNVKYAYFHKDKGKVIHWFRYIYRYPSWDMFKLVVRQGRYTSPTSPPSTPTTPSPHPTPTFSPPPPPVTAPATTAPIMFNNDSSMTIYNRDAVLQRLYDINEKAQKVSWAGWMAPTNRIRYTARLGHYMSLKDRRLLARELASTCSFIGPDGQRCGAVLLRLKTQHWNDYDTLGKPLTNDSIQNESRRSHGYA